MHRLHENSARKTLKQSIFLVWYIFTFKITWNQYDWFFNESLGIVFLSSIIYNEFQQLLWYCPPIRDLFKTIANLCAKYTRWFFLAKAITSEPFISVKNISQSNTWKKSQQSLTIFSSINIHKLRIYIKTNWNIKHVCGVWFN